MKPSIVACLHHNSFDSRTIGGSSDHFWCIPHRGLDLNKPRPITPPSALGRTFVKSEIRARLGKPYGMGFCEIYLVALGEPAQGYTVKGLLECRNFVENSLLQ